MHSPNGAQQGKVLIAWLIVAVCFISVLAHAQSRKPDIVFVPGPLLTTSRQLIVEPSFEQVRELHFNGDWTGVMLCRAKKCVRFEEVFNADR